MSNNKIWIELVHPRKAELPDGADRKTFAEEQCRLANNLLKRLGDGNELKSNFFWSDHDGKYCFGGHMGYVTLEDNGEWFNLDYLGRPACTAQ